MEYIAAALSGRSAPVTAALRSTSLAFYNTVECRSSLVPGWTPRRWERLDDLDRNTASRLTRCSREGGCVVTPGPSRAEICPRELREFVSAHALDGDMYYSVSLRIEDNTVPLCKLSTKHLTLIIQCNDALDCVIEGLHNFNCREVSLNIWFVRENKLRDLPLITNVTSMELHGCGIDDVSLQRITEFRLLRNLHMQANPLQFTTAVGDDFCHRLAELPSLESVTLCLNDIVTDAGVGHFGLLFTLTSLELTCSNVTDEGVRSIMRNPKLMNLSLTGMRPLVTDVGLRYVGDHGGLTSLRLWGLDGVNDEGIGHVVENRRLRSLTLGWLNNVTDEGLRFVGACGCGLTSLCLGYLRRVTDEGVRAAIRNPKLASLSLEYLDSITDDGLRYIWAHRALTSLKLSHLGRVTDEGLFFVSNLERLRSLTLYGLRSVTDEGLRCVGALTTLTLLKVSHMMSITTDGFRDVVNLPNLTRLMIPKVPTNERWRVEEFLPSSVEFITNVSIE